MLRHHPYISMSFHSQVLHVAHAIIAQLTHYLSSCLNLHGRLQDPVLQATGRSRFPRKFEQKAGSDHPGDEDERAWYENDVTVGRLLMEQFDNPSTPPVMLSLGPGEISYSVNTLAPNQIPLHAIVPLLATQHVHALMPLMQAQLEDIESWPNDAREDPLFVSMEVHRRVMEREPQNIFSGMANVLRSNEHMPLQLLYAFLLASSPDICGQVAQYAKVCSNWFAAIGVNLKVTSPHSCCSLRHGRREMFRAVRTNPAGVAGLAWQHCSTSSCATHSRPTLCVSRVPSLPITETFHCEVDTTVLTGQIDSHIHRDSGKQE